MEYEVEKSSVAENNTVFIKPTEEVTVFKPIKKSFFEAIYEWAFGTLPTLKLKYNIMQYEVEKEEPNQKQLYKEMSLEFDKYLDNHIWNFAVEFIENGYKPSKNQYFQYKKMLSEVIAKNNNFMAELMKITPIIHEDVIELIVDNNETIIFDLINMKQIIPAKIAAQAVIKLASSDKKLFNSEYIKFKKLIENNITENEISSILFVVNSNIQTAVGTLLDNLKLEYEGLGSLGDRNNAKVSNFSNLINNSFHLFYALSPQLKIEDLESYNKTIITIEKTLTAKAKKLASRYENGKYFAENCESLNIKIFAPYQKTVQELIRNNLVNKKNEVLKKIKSLNGDQILEQKINTSIHSANISVKQELPQEAQQVIKNINEKYDNIINCSMSPEDTEELKKLYEMRVPEILKKFLVIDKQYRIELKNIQGKNAQELMLESLKNIEHIFEAKLIEVNENRLSDLSVTQRYTSAIKTRKLN